MSFATLDPAAAARGFRLETCETIGSTNDGLFERAATGEPGPLWLLSREQTGGRGRLGRRWSSPPGNLYASLLLIEPAPVANIAELGFVTGVAVATALLDLGVPRDELTIKWPNDLVAGGAKFSGILLETRVIAARRGIAIGIGLNCVPTRTESAYPTTDLSTLLGRPVAVGEVFTPLSRRMAEGLESWQGGARFAAVRDAWLALAGGIGTPVTVDLGTRHLQGLFRSIDPRGRLLLQTVDGEIAVDAGDVFLRES